MIELYRDALRARGLDQIYLREVPLQSLPAGLPQSDLLKAG
jgi:hypothetical protein